MCISPWTLGHLAYLDGLTESMCPFLDTESVSQWLAGWHHAEIMNS